MARPFQIPWGKPVQLNPAHHGEWRKAVERDHSLSPTARLVGCVISEGINWGRNPKYLHLKGRTWQTQEQLATEIGISERQVRRCIEQLEARGWIATEQRALGRATTTRLMWPRFPFDRTPVSGGRKIKTRTQRAVTGQFMQASLDAEVRCDRTPVTGHHLEDHLDNYLDGAASRGLHIRLPP